MSPARVLLLVSVACFANAEMVRFDHQKVVRVTKDSVEDVWQDILDKMDVWGSPEPNVVDIRVTEEHLEFLRSAGAEMKVVVENVQHEIDREGRTLEKRSKSANATAAEWFSNYHTYAEIVAWYQQLASDAPDRVTFLPSIGSSHEGRALFAAVFTDKSVTAPKHQIYVQGLIHAREWVAGSTVQWISHDLALGTSANTLDILRRFEIHVVPVVNPDGYSFTWTSNRMWRKNRRPCAGNQFGVDNNRNFDDHWGQGGGSTLCSSETYYGPSAASEPENQAIQRYACTLPRMIAAFDYHSFSQLILRPYGWTRNNPDDDAALVAAGAGYRAEVGKVHGRSYVSQKWIDMYVATGIHTDWFYGPQLRNCIGRRAYAYTIELRPTGQNPGFQLPPSEIVPTGQENLPAFYWLINYAAANPLRP